MGRWPLIILLLICTGPGTLSAIRLKRDARSHGAFKAHMRNVTTNTTGFGVLEGIFIGVAVVAFAAKTVHHFFVDDAQCGAIIEGHINGRQWKTSGLGRFVRTLHHSMGGVLGDLAFGVEHADKLPQVDCQNMVSAYEIQVITFAYTEGAKLRRGLSADHQNPDIVNEFFFEGVRDALNEGDEVIKQYAREVRNEIIEAAQDSKEEEAKATAEQMANRVAKVMSDAVAIVKEVLAQDSMIQPIIDRVGESWEGIKSHYEAASQVTQLECQDTAFCENSWRATSGDPHGVFCGDRLVHNTGQGFWGKAKRGGIPVISYLVAGWGLKLLLIKWAMVAHASAALIKGMWGFGLPDVMLGLNRYISRAVGWTKTKKMCNLRRCQWDADEQTCVLGGAEDEDLQGNELPMLGTRCVKRESGGLLRSTTICVPESCPHMADDTFYANAPIPHDERWNCRDPQPVKAKQSAQWSEITAKANRATQIFQTQWKPLLLATNAPIQASNLYDVRRQYRVVAPASSQMSAPRILGPIIVGPTVVMRAPTQQFGNITRGQSQLFAATTGVSRPVIPSANSQSRLVAAPSSTMVAPTRMVSGSSIAPTRIVSSSSLAAPPRMVVSGATAATAPRPPTVMQVAPMTVAAPTPLRRVA